MQMKAVPASGAGAPPKMDGLPQPQRQWAFATMCAAVSLATLETAIANTALPTIAADLHVSPADAVWVVNAYQLASVVTLLPLAALGEIFGYRVIYMAGLLIFTAASLVCATATSLPVLAVSRAMQGIGASGIMSVNTALIRYIFPTRMLGRALGTNALVVAVAFAIGPTVASAILAVATWPWLFAINVPIGLGALFVALRTLPDTPRSTHPFDAWSALLNAGAFGLLILALGEGAHQARPLTVVLEFLGGIIFGYLLLRRQTTQPAPMLPVDLFRRPLFALSALTAFCSFSAQGLAFVSLPFFFQTSLGRSEVETGFLMTPWPVFVGLIAPIAGRLSDRYSAAVLCGCGMAMLCAGMVALALLGPHPQVWDIGWRMALAGAGFGFYQSPNLRAIMTSAPPERSGGASGIVATARLMGQTTGAALVALCFSVSPFNGAMLALAVGAAFAAFASIISFLRLMTA